MRPRAGARQDGQIIIDPNAYLVDCFRLARQIWDDGYRPDFLIALWRGGTAPGIVIQEYLRWKGHDPYHTAIRTRSLDHMRHGGGFDIRGFKHIVDTVDASGRMLLVDDLFDTGRTLYEVTDYLRRKARHNTPELRTATVYYRPDRRQFLIGPHYYLHETKRRPIFPHCLTQLGPKRIQKADPELHEAISV